MTYIETPRLILRSWKESDYLPFIDMNADEDVMKYFPNILSKEESLQTIDQVLEHFDKWSYGVFAAELKEDQEFIGAIGLSHPTFNASFTPCVEILWRLSKQYWGQGYATEGARAVISYAFNTLGLKEIYSFTTLNNTASENVMKKIGMRKIGVFHHPKLPEENPLCEHLLYRLNATE